MPEARPDRCPCACRSDSAAASVEASAAGSCADVRSSSGANSAAFRAFAQVFAAHQMAHPQIKRPDREIALPAEFLRTEIAVGPARDLRQPVRAADLGPRAAGHHPEILHKTKEPDMIRDCTTSNMCRDRTLTHPTERWQDKRAHRAHRSGYCFYSFFWHVLHRAVLIRTVHEAIK